MTLPEPKFQEKALKRVVAVSRVNGWSIFVVAVLGTLLALLLGDLVSVFVGALVAAAGGMEIRGNKRLRRRDPDGMKLLVRSQLFLMSVILVYCATRLGSFDAETVMAGVTPDMEAILKDAGIERADILSPVRSVFYAIYLTLAVTCLIYQGGMALYYRARTNRVRESLSAPQAEVVDDGRLTASR